MLEMGPLLAPIPGAKTAGASLRHEPVYTQIKEARREDDGLPKGEWESARKEADWALVVRLASDALTKRTKDLELAGWLTEALLHRDGIVGLRDGLALVHQLLEQFWDGVYPEIDEDGAEARAARVEWIGVKLDGAVRRSPLTADLKSLIDYRTSRTIPTKEEAESDEAKRSTRAQATNDKKVTPEEFEASFAATPKAWYRQLVSDLDTTDAAIQSLDDLCRQRFGDVSPSFRPLRDAVLDVRQVAGQLLARKPPEAGDPAGAVAGAPSAVGAAGMASESTSRVAGTFSSEGPRTREEAAAWIAAAATRIRRDHPTEPAAYLVVRGFRWGELRAAGGAIDPRLLIAPSTETRIRLRGLRLDARWAELLDAAEELMATPVGRGWVDLQRYVLNSCAALGGEYEAVRVSIRGALRALLADIPDLPSLTLMDDSPTTNAETLAWLRAEGLVDGGPKEVTTPPAWSY